MINGAITGTVNAISHGLQNARISVCMYGMRPMPVYFKFE